MTMNERIRELAEQARDYAEYVTPQGLEWFDNFKEKFAELIVRECADIANEQFSAASGLNDRDSWTAAEIKKRFGVEE